MVSMTRKVFLEPLWKLHVGYHVHELAPCPPQGYEFVLPKTSAGRLIPSLSQRTFTPGLYTLLGQVAPVSLLRSLLDSKIANVPDGCDLVYCCHHFSFRKQPWVAEIDAIWDPIGPGYRVFRLFQPLVERIIRADSCKAVLVFTDFSKQVLLSALRHPEAKEKVTVLPRAVRPKTAVASHQNEDFHLLFMGSANLAGEFQMRGGKEVLDAFRILSARYPAVRLTIRSDIPADIARRYEDVLTLPSVRWISDWVSAEELEQLYTSASALVLPGHYDNWLVVLEAMSYGLPVIATDVYANHERIHDGRTGLLVRPSRHVPYYQGGLPLFTFTRRFQRAIRHVDPAVVEDLAAKVVMLVEDRNLTRRMGHVAKAEVENGSFSIANRNRVLKEVFDRAMDGANR
jgi:glycosyltransferase involved in cell wall biosynthesis